jgi:hypothetical protein
MNCSMKGRFCDHNVECWIGDMLRRYHAKHPGSLMAWRKHRNWVKLIEWEATPGGWKPDHIEDHMNCFLRANDNCLGSDNPWSIHNRTVTRKIGIPGQGGYTYPMAEYSITLVLTEEEQTKYLRERWRAQQELEAVQFREMEPSMIQSIDDI